MLDVPAASPRGAARARASTVVCSCPRRGPSPVSSFSRTGRASVDDGIRERKKEAIHTKLFVGNLSFDTTSEELRALFAEAGEVVSVVLPTDRDTGRPRGFAFVELASSEAATAAIDKLNGSELGGRALRVNEATERPAGGSGFRSGGFGAGAPAHRPRPKGSRRNLRARKHGF